MYSSLQTPHRYYENSHAIWDHSVTCHLAQETFPPLPQPIKAGTQLIDLKRLSCKWKWQWTDDEFAMYYNYKAFYQL